jgi:hypothetical protein
MKLIERQKRGNLLCSQELKERWWPSPFAQRDTRTYTSHSTCMYKEQLCLDITGGGNFNYYISCGKKFDFRFPTNDKLVLINEDNVNINYTFFLYFVDRES